MTIFYVDPVSGNDASAGTSFATRWQTLSTGAGTGKVAAGDTVRVIGSPEPTSMAQDATWTDGSSTVALTTAVTQELVFSGAWVASANASSVASANRKIGANASQIAVTASFTTGKAAYFTLASEINLSLYQQISCWINLTVGSMVADGNISLRLCSDTIGNVTVNTIPLRRSTSTYQASTFDNGAALGSSIRSIAIYIESDRGAQTILINHVLACKASSEPDSLTLNSLISKNVDNEAWIGINSISGTNILLDLNPAYSPTSNMSLYSGITSTQLLYKREPIVLPTSLSGSTWGGIQNSGTIGNPITYSGGWAGTDMSTQSGDTYISAIAVTNATAINVTGQSNINIERLNLSRFGVGFLIGGGGGAVNVNITAKNINSCSSSGLNFSNSVGDYCSNVNISIDNICGHTLYGIDGGSGIGNTAVPIVKNNITVGNLNANRTCGLLLRGSRHFVYNITNLNRNCTSGSATGGGIYGGTAVASSISTDCVVNITNIKDNPTQAIYAISGTVFTNNIFNITGTVSGNNIFINMANNTGNIFNLNNATITDNNADISATNCSLVVNGGIFDAVGVKIPTATYSNILLNNISVTGGPIASSLTTTAPIKIITANLNGNTADNRIYYSTNFGTILTDSAIRHTASGISWKMTAGSDFMTSPADYNPLSLPIAKIACNSGTLVTASVWVYRTSTSLTTKFVCAGGQIAGVPTNVSTSASGAIDTWEQLTITFTPSQQGVVELQVDCYGAAASVYVDDFSVSQA